MTRLVLCIIISFLCAPSYSQSPRITEGNEGIRLIDRWDVLFNTELHTSLRNTPRKKAVQETIRLLPHLDKKEASYLILDNYEYYTISDSTNHEKIYKDSSGLFYTLDNENIKGPTFNYEKDPFLKYFYRSRPNAYEVNNDDFILKVNPILNLKLGTESQSSDFPFNNTRGIEVRALIDNKVYLYTSILENQARFNNFRERRIQEFSAIPGNGFFKNYNSRVSDRINGWDFLNSQGYVGFNISKSVNLEFGHGRHFIGNGVRSLLLSDWSHNYFFLKFDTHIWKFRYQNIFAELSPISGRLNPNDRLLPKKYMANHYLSFKATPSLEIGLFESVVFSRENTFEFQYLNPVILYRSVEQFLDSPDNVLLGLNVKWNLLNQYQLYGQLIFDEFKLNELTAGNGWWANKYGYQLGIKYINAFNIDKLDLQAELNSVRPYTYSHRNPLENFPEISVANYTHFNQPLAHPLGANFRELILKGNFNINYKWLFQGRFIRSIFGDDDAVNNWGGNPLTPSGTRVQDFGNELGQGVKTDVTLLGLDISYVLYHNYFIDFNFIYRKSTSEITENNLNTTYFGGGLRANIGQISMDY